MDTADANAADEQRVLVVDDDAGLATALAYLLQLMGCRTAAAYDGMTAVRLAGLFRPHLSLIDLELPGLDGCETVRLIREQEAPAHHRVVCLTGRNSPQDKQRCLEAGFDAFVVKPMEIDALAKLLKLCKEQGTAETVVP